jgi:hypothetical protein
VTTVSGSAVIVAIPTATPSLAGHLDPNSDTGISHTDGITRDNTPTYVGTSAPTAVVSLFAQAAGGSPLLIGQGVTDAAGQWSITPAFALGDGVYAVTGTAVIAPGTPTPSISFGTLVVDTVGPRVTGVSFNRFTGRFTVTYQDNLSGLDQFSLVDGANYRFSARPVSAKVAVPGQLFALSASVTPASLATDPQTVILTLNHRLPLRGGRYLLAVLSGGIGDVAGNALDGNFYGTLPSGNGLPGGNFVAQITSFHRTTFAPVPVQDGYANPATPAPTPVIVPVLASRTAGRRTRVHQSRAHAKPARIVPASGAAGVNGVHDAAIASLVSG